MGRTGRLWIWLSLGALLLASVLALRFGIRMRLERKWNDCSGFLLSDAGVEMRALAEDLATERSLRVEAYVGRWGVWTFHRSGKLPRSREDILRVLNEAGAHSLRKAAGKSRIRIGRRLVRTWRHYIFISQGEEAPGPPAHGTIADLGDGWYFEVKGGT